MSEIAGLVAKLVANIVDSDQTPRSVASDLSLHCLLRPVVGTR